MYIDKSKLISKLDNHQKLLSMINDSIIPIKQTLIEDVIEIKEIIEVAHRQNRKEKIEQKQKETK